MGPLSPRCVSAAAALHIMWWALLIALDEHVVDAKLTVQVEASLPDDPRTASKTWTIRAANDGNGLTAELLALSTSTLDKVFVSYDPAAAASISGDPDSLRAIVRVSGDNQWRVDALTVSISSTSDNDSDRESQRLQLYSSQSEITIEVVLVQPYQVQSLSVLGSGDVVVGDQVLAAGSADAVANGDPPKLKIDVLGVGNAFVATTEPLRATSASFRISASGNLQIEAPEFHFETLTIKNFAGSAGIKLLSSSPLSGSTVTSASFVTTASGGICWDVPNLHVGNLEVSVQGSGFIKATGTGSCDTETVRASGSGDVRLGSVRCQRAQVSVVGSGDVVVQASQYLGGVITGSGDVRYTGQQPLTMSDKNGQVGTSTPSYTFRAIAKPTTATPSKKCTRKLVPTLKKQMKPINWVPGPPPSDYPGGPSDENATHSVASSADVGTSSSSMPTCPACNQLWDTIKANTIIVIPVSVFVVFWIVILLLSRRERRRGRRDPEQQYLLDHHHRNREEQEDRHVYV